MKSIKILEMFWQKSRDKSYNLDLQQAAILYYILNKFDKEGWPESITIDYFDIAKVLCDYAGYVSHYLYFLEKAGIIISDGNTITLPQIEESQEEKPQGKEALQSVGEGAASSPTEAEFVVEAKAQVVQAIQEVQAVQELQAAKSAEAVEFKPQRKLHLPRQSRIIPQLLQHIPRWPKYEICNKQYAISNNSPPGSPSLFRAFLRAASIPRIESNRIVHTQTNLSPSQVMMQQEICYSQYSPPGVLTSECYPVITSSFTSNL